MSNKKFDRSFAWMAEPAPRALVATLVLALAVLAMLNLINGHARADASLNVDIIAGYNLVVDSNVSSPSTYAPRVATVIGKFCNPGTTDLTDVYGYIGNGTTAGTYPIKNNWSVDPGQNYYFRHVGPTSDASRYIGTIPAGQCVYQYWTIEYPACSNANPAGAFTPPCTGSSVPTWGASVKPDDDLSLQFVIWGTGKDGVTTRTGSNTWTMTMRNEISAMANKIEPNGNPAGRWFNTTSPVRVGDVITTNGVLYSLGNVRFGFDNDLDYAPDYNAWVQPISQANYDPTCFRLIRTSGLLTVTRGGGNPTMFINFKDTLYFTNIPADNTNVRGEVYYTFLALNGPCSMDLSPYQKVASSFDNEKFNGDYGTGLPPVESLRPNVTIDKASAPNTLNAGGTTTYTIPFANTGTAAAGLSMSTYGINMPLVISDTVPHGMQLAAAASYYISGTGSVSIRYSTDSGATWTSSAPVGTTSTWPNNKIIIQWWLDQPLPAGSTGNWARFRATVPAGYSGTPFIQNTACIGLGDAAPFACDPDIVIVNGTGAIGDLVWRDENNDGQQTGETTYGINGVAVSLYWDRNGNGQLDAGDLLLSTQDTRTFTNPGYYQFTQLPAANYLVVVDKTDADLPTGYRLTTPGFYAVALASGQSYQTADFGFGPSLTMVKQMLSTGVTGCDAYEGREVVYSIALTNERPGTGETVPGGCRYSVWSTTGSTASPPKSFTNYANAFGAPDNLYASGDFSIGGSRWIQGTGFDPGSASGTIGTVQAVFRVYLSASLTNDEAVARLYYGTTEVVNTFTTAQLNAFAGSANAGYLVWTIPGSSAPGGSWTWDDFAQLTLRFEPKKNTDDDGRILYVDAIGFRVTTGSACPAIDPNDIMVTVPLTDTYNTTYLQFVSADPPQTAVNTSTGLITWANVGPIYPGQTRIVTVRFLAKPISGTSSQTVNNSAGSTGSRFADGGYANNVYRTASGTICQTGSINGYVYSDPNSSGWNYSPSGGDLPIPGVRVTIYGCYNRTTGDLVAVPAPAPNQNCESGASQNNGEWRVRATMVTNAAGYYEFNGLLNGFYYVEVTSGDIPGTKSQTAEANDSQTVSGTLPDTTALGGGNNNSTWGVRTATLNTSNFNPINSAGETINGVNFGYNIQAGAYGSVWEDKNGNGVKDTGEGPIPSVTVRIYANSDCSGASLASTTTDANGRYQFGNLTAGATYCIAVNTSTLPGGSSAWTQTGESDGSINNRITFTAVAGTLSGSHDFGFRKVGTYTLGDTLYYDWNGDGTQQPTSEEGIPNVTVYLYEDSNGSGSIDPGDALVATTSTNASGYYQFTGLPAATYMVLVATDDPDFPAGVVQTQDPDESGVCQICNSRGRRTITNASFDNVDFGYQPRGNGAIGDTVWRDMNGNGVQAGPSETGIANITVWLEADLNNDGTYVRVATAVTDSSGKYLFSNLPDAKYRVVVDSSDTDLPKDPYGHIYVPSTPTSIAPITISGGNTYLGADFGFKPLGAIGDRVWQDNNGNGNQDIGEPGINGVTVGLYTWTDVDGDGVYSAITDTLSSTPLATRVTSDDGNYLFSGLAAGNYVVKVISGIPSGYSQSGDPDWLEPCAGSGLCDGASGVTLRTGQIDMSRDFGYVPPGVIGDYIWFDNDGDGVQDAGEQGIPYVTVRLCSDADCNSVLATTQTDSDGYYSFGNLSGTSYYVRVDNNTLPNGVTPTYDLDGTGTPHVTAVALPQGGSNLNADFGYRYVGDYDISGHVFFDAGSTTDGTNDIYNNSEDYAYEGMTLYLWRDGKMVGQTTTNSNGYYAFTNLPPGNYTVSVDRSGALGLMALTATPNNTPQVKGFNTVAITNANITNQDFGFYASMDMGDLPESYNKGNDAVDSQFYTLFAYEGPIHINRSGSVSPTIYLGTTWDNEADGHPDINAGTAFTGTLTGGDDLAGSDDEDGIGFLDDWYQSGSARLRITITDRDDKYTPYLVGWFDWNQDGRFGAGEMIDFGEFGANRPGGRQVGPYTYIYTETINIPSNTSRVLISGPGVAADYRIYMRFRLYATQSSPPVISPIGAVSNGEVEDYWRRNYGPLAVTLASFTAAPEGQAIRLDWETASELNNIGFNLYRSLTPQGPWTKLNDGLIAAANPGSVIGASYTYLDERVKPSLTYYYMLEDIDRETGATQHGPVSATLGAGPRPFKLYLPVVFGP